MRVAERYAGPLTSVDVGTSSLGRFAEVLPREQFDDMRARIVAARRALLDRTVWNVNSTARGGGVAEMLVSLLAYARGEGVDARWRVIGGDHAFFVITKRIHNRLHGFPGDGRSARSSGHTTRRRSSPARRRCAQRSGAVTR